MRIGPVALALAVGIGVGLVEARAHACCPAFPPTPDTTVRIADQEIIVAWNAESKTEQFVRKASFQARVPGFGFLVPTPSRPVLAEVDEAVFDRLRREIEPRIVNKTRWVPSPTTLCGGWLSLGSKGDDRTVPASVAAPVRVLEEARVAGFDYAVLAADDPAALTAWLEAKGYDARPAMREWVVPYVTMKWIVTAFKFAADAGDVGTGAIRMSFVTERPVFPYRVPEDQLARRGAEHTLRVFFVGPGRGQGTLGDRGASWAGVTKYATSRPLSPLATLLAGAVPAVDAPAGAWLTAFEDPSWPSGTEDLWFGSDPAGAELIPTVVVYHDREVPIPLDVLLVAGIGVALVVRWQRKRRKSA
jgi:hypothetical protein